MTTIASIVRKLPQRPGREIRARASAIDAAPTQMDVEPAIDSPPAQRSKSEPLAPGRFKLQFTVGEETYRKLRRLQIFFAIGCRAATLTRFSIVP